MSRPGLAHQRGFGLLSFVLVTLAVAATLVVGYSGALTREAANQLHAAQERRLAVAMDRISATWTGPRAAAYDATDVTNATTASDVLEAAGITLRNGERAHLSQVLQHPSEPISYRSLVIYLSSESDGENPPDLAAFEATGVFQSCADPALPCAERPYRVFSSLETQRALYKDTATRLQSITLRAQAYFKARMLQDPEKNIGINYWRRPFGGCTVMPLDLGCEDVYAPLAVYDASGSLVPSLMATNLALTGQEYITPYGWPLEASNLEDSETGATPFSMAFRALLPNGTYLTALAVQQL